MFENITKFFKKFGKNEKENSKNTAKERLHLVLAQDRANISADFLEMMKQEIIDVIKKYIDIDEEAIDVRMTNKPGEDGIIGAPALYANIPIVTIKNETRKLDMKKEEVEENKETAPVEEASDSESEDAKSNQQEEKEINDQKVEEKEEAEEQVAVNKETESEEVEVKEEQDKEVAKEEETDNEIKEKNKVKTK